MAVMNETEETTLPEHLSLLRADLNVVWSILFFGRSPNHKNLVNKILEIYLVDFDTTRFDDSKATEES